MVTAEGKRPELSDFPSPFRSIVSSMNRYERVVSNLNVLTGADKGKPHLCSHQQQPRYNIIRCTIFRVGRRAEEGNNWSFFWQFQTELHGSMRCNGPAQLFRYQKICKQSINKILDLCWILINSGRILVHSAFCHHRRSTSYLYVIT